MREPRDMPPESESTAQAGGSVPLVADVVIFFRGGTVAEDLAPDDVLGPSRLAGYTVMPGQRFARRVMVSPKGRGLIRLGRITNSFGDLVEFSVRTRLAVELQTILSDINAEPGLTMVHGSSSGGRVALNFASSRAAGGKPVHYIGAIDAAFFPNETKTVPKIAGTKPSEVPEFSLEDVTEARQNTKAKHRHNWFQTVGNHAKQTFLHGILFTSDLDDEIHGEIRGFDNHPLTVASLDSDKSAHSNCFGEGFQASQDLIAAQLRAVG